jgi:hypothetical protein
MVDRLANLTGTSVGNGTEKVLEDAMKLAKEIKGLASQNVWGVIKVRNEYLFGTDHFADAETCRRTYTKIAWRLYILMRPEFIQCWRTEGQSYDRCCDLSMMNQRSNLLVDHSGARTSSKGLENLNSARNVDGQDVVKEERSIELYLERSPGDKPALIHCGIYIQPRIT